MRRNPLPLLLLSVPLLSGCALPFAGHRGPGLAVENGRFVRDGRPYRGVGANYFDLFLRTLHKPGDTTSLDGLGRLADAGIPFVRFALLYSAADAQRYLDTPDVYFLRLDAVVQAAERRGVGLIPSFFWDFARLPAVVGETRDQWGNPASRTHAFMRRFTADVMRRYRGSPALWAWEFGNEANLMADLPNAAQFRPKGGSERDDFATAHMLTMLAEFGREVRRHDARRPIFAGHSHPRASAWHNTAERSWTADTREQTLAVVQRDNPEPLDTLGIHLYATPAVAKDLAGWAADHRQYLEAVAGLARGLRRPLWVGEFGAPAGGDEAAVRAAFEGLIAAMEQAGVDLAAFWVFDLPAQNQDWNVTPDNARAYMLRLAAEANRRWNAAAPRP